jgi:hypothetical protein
MKRCFAQSSKSANTAACFDQAQRLEADEDIRGKAISGRLLSSRLLFRLLSDPIQVVDLIPRQDLERKIKTLK